MGLSRRHLLLALGLALPATVILSEDADAATAAQLRRRRAAKAAAAKKKKPTAHATRRRGRHGTA